MNHTMFGLILICCLARAIETNGYHPILNFFETLRSILKTGTESLGVPTLDQFTAERIPIKLNEKIINLDALLTNVNMNGLSKYKVDSDFQIFFMIFNINLSWPLITTSTDYVMKGNADSYEIYGNGEIDLSAQDFTLETEISFTVNEEHFKVKNMKLKLFLRALDFHATGLFNDDEISNIMSGIISDMAPKMFEDATVIDKLKSLAITKIDAFLSTKTLKEWSKIFLRSIF
ncbi:uncharacterized protein [Anoplolepis gracilipes]|uniref:uncharacterized protein isoform X2 n=1 Tax=Anoplolepis gracilipes TaxID=354296 RepID=UPI003BA1B71B